VREVAGLADSVASMAAQLQARLAYISEFASNVSHEFKTPLATLRGTVELLAEDDEMPTDQRTRFLDNASRELDRLERLVSGLLHLARADEGSEHEAVGLQELLDGVAAARGVELQGTAGVVSGSRAQLEAVAVNLVDNALTHGGDGVTVRVEAFTTDGRTGFRVVDDGVGITEANLPRIFDRFFTTHRAGGGTGLGLALVRAICERHGGHITARSEAGRTVFEVELPRATT
jgi:signal transduction histidine kinase